MKAQVASELRAIFQFRDEVSATTLLNQFMSRYQQSAPELAKWADKNFIEG